MPKESSTPRAAAQRRPARKNLAASKRRDTNGNVTAGGNLRREEDVTRHTEMARELVLAAWPGIVRGLIKKAMGGGYQQTKLLLDLCEITGSDGSQSGEQRRRQLCDALLEGLGLPGTQAKDEAAGQDAGEQPENTGAL